MGLRWCQAADSVLIGLALSVFADYGQTFEIIDPLDRSTGDDTGAGVVEAPMPGQVKAVFVKNADQVATGDRLAILEAMKMEHTLTASRDGTVAEVLVSDGDQVDAGDVLIRLEDEE